IKATLEGIARIDVLTVDPRLAVLPVDVVPQEHLVHLVDVRILGKHDVPGHVEGESTFDERTTPSADGVVALQKQGILAKVIRGAQASRSRADDDDRSWGTGRSCGRLS